MNFSENFNRRRLRWESIVKNIDKIVKLRSFRTLLLALLLVTASVGVYRSIHGGSDFDGFYQRVSEFRKTGNMPFEHTVRRYPPTFQIILLPLTLFRLPIATVIWQMINLLALLMTPKAFEELSYIPPNRQWPAWLFVSPFILDNFLLGQSAPILIFLVTTGLALVKRNRAICGSFLIGIAGLLKIFPVVLVVVPFVMRRFRDAFLGIVITVLFGAGIMILAMSPNYAINYTSRWIKEIRTEHTPWAYAKKGTSLRYNNQSLAITIARTISPVENAKGAVRLALLPIRISKIIFTGLVIIVVTVWILVAWHVYKFNLPENLIGLMAMTIIAVLTVSPIVWTHYFMWLLPAAIFFVHRSGFLMICSIISLSALASNSARALGVHTGLSLLFYFLIASDILAEDRGSNLHRLLPEQLRNQVLRSRQGILF